MSPSRWLSTALAVIALGACTNEKIVFKSRDNFNAPADTLNGFLGYFDVSTKQTTCGNCHVEKQAEWKATMHASAWDHQSAAVPNAPAACRACHTVTQLGNAVPDSVKAGYALVADPSYYDVQCENCHGPGFDHAQAPNLSNIPLARVSLSPDTLVSVTSPTCAACHNRSGGPAPSFVEEWSQSGHARVVPEIAEEGFPASCVACHEGRGVLKAWGVKTNYVERDQPLTPATGFAQTCAVCHDPHANNNEGQLRWPIDDPDPANNLCMKCHNRRTDPSASSPRGPHAPQGAVLLGYAGWWPDVRDTVAATHGSVTSNPRLCAGCHVNQITVSGGGLPVAFKSVGHLFSPDPCLDANGTPTAGDCARPGDAGYVSGSRAFTGCALTCHNQSVTQVENAMSSQRAVIGQLADALWKDVDRDTVMYDTLPGGRFGAFDAGDTGLLTQLTAAQADTAFNFKDGKISVAEGVFFNVRLIGEARYANGDRSLGVHNPLLSQTLLSISIDALKQRYGLAVPPAVQAVVDQTLRRVAKVRASRVSSR